MRATTAILAGSSWFGLMVESQLPGDSPVGQESSVPAVLLEWNFLH